MNLIKVFAGVAACALLIGCAATKNSSVVEEFDATTGKVTKRTTTESSESVVKNLVESTKNKTIVAWESGWAGYLSVSMATESDPTPTGKIFAGKVDKGLISALPQQQDWDGIAKTVMATKYELNVSTDGMSNQSASTDKKAK